MSCDLSIHAYIRGVNPCGEEGRREGGRKGYIGEKGGGCEEGREKGREREREMYIHTGTTSDD